MLLYKLDNAWLLLIIIIILLLLLNGCFWTENYNNTNGPPSYLRGSKSSVANSKDTIRPLVRDGVKLAVQLAHGDGFGINNCDQYLVLIH